MIAQNRFLHLVHNILNFQTHNIQDENLKDSYCRIFFHSRTLKTKWQFIQIEMPNLWHTSPDTRVTAGIPMRHGALTHWARVQPLNYSQHRSLVTCQPHWCYVESNIFHPCSNILSSEVLFTLNDEEFVFSNKLLPLKFQNQILKWQVMVLSLTLD